MSNKEWIFRYLKYQAQPGMVEDVYHSTWEAEVEESQV
jgi:hypothetical protein